MKGNFIKYIFFIFVIVIMGYAIYKINDKEEVTEEVPKETWAEEEITKEIKLGIAEFDTINPIISNNKYVQEISRIIYEPLLTIDENYKIQSCLAKEWAKTSETTYILKLREDVKWSDGSDFTANDVLYTIDRLKDTASIYGVNVQYIVEVLIIDSYTLQITLSQEIPFFEYNLTFPIMSQKYYEGQDFVSTQKNDKPVGTGPFTIVENTDTTIVLSKNEKYYGEKQTLETITINKYSTILEMYNAFKLGKIDLVTTTNPNIQDYIGTIGYTIQETAGKQYDFIALNTQNQVLAYQEVRKALCYAINKENIVGSIYNGKYRVANYPLEYGNWILEEKKEISYDPSLAKQILQEAGWEYKYDRWQKIENYKTTKLSLKLVVQNSNEARVAIAEMIKSNLEEIGIKITLVKASDAQYQNYLQEKNYDMILVGKNLSLSPNLESYFGQANLANYSDEEVSTIMNEVKNITDEKLLKEKYKRLYEIYTDQMPYIGLYNSYYAVASSISLTGKITANWYNIFTDICNWYKN